MIRRKGLLIGAVLAAVLTMGMGAASAQASGFGFVHKSCHPHVHYYRGHYGWHRHYWYPRHYHGYAWRPSFGYTYNYHEHYGDRGTFSGGYYKYSK